MTKRKKKLHWTEHALTWFCVVIIVGLLGTEAYFILKSPHSHIDHAPPVAQDDCYPMKDKNGVWTYCGSPDYPFNPTTN